MQFYTEIFRSCHRKRH